MEKSGSEEIVLSSEEWPRLGRCVVLNTMELLMGFASKLDVETNRRLEVNPCILDGGGTESTVGEE